MSESGATSNRKSEREQILRNFALILHKADPKHVHFYIKEDRIYDGKIRKNPRGYKLSYDLVVNLGKLHASLSSSEQPLLITMAAHQTRRDSPLCRYTPQIFAFLAKYFSFGRATEP